MLFIIVIKFLAWLIAFSFHHDLINTDYFSTIKYVKEIEKEINRNIKRTK